MRERKFSLCFHTLRLFGDKRVIATLFSFLGFVSICSGQEHKINGSWKLADSPVEEKSRKEAIGQLAAGLPRFAQTRVSEKLTSSTAPTQKLELSFEGKQLLMREDEREFKLTLDSTPVQISSKNGRGKVSLRKRSGLLILTAQAENAKRTVVFRPSKDGKTLTLDVTLSVSSLGKTARYKTKYQRQ